MIHAFAKLIKPIKEKKGQTIKKVNFFCYTNHNCARSSGVINTGTSANYKYISKLTYGIGGGAFGKGDSRSYTEAIFNAIHAKIYNRPLKYTT